jgi:hypothetical protein
MTRLPLYHETAGLGRAGWPRGDCLVLDEIHGLSPGCLHDRIRTLVETATRALSPLPPPDGLLTPAEAARKPPKPRRPTLAGVAKQASKAALDVARYEVRPDGTVVVVTGKPEPAASENLWPLDEFRRKEAKR